MSVIQKEQLDMRSFERKLENPHRSQVEEDLKRLNEELELTLKAKEQAIKLNAELENEKELLKAEINELSKRCKRQEKQIEILMKLTQFWIEKELSK